MPRDRSDYGKEWEEAVCTCGEEYGAEREGNRPSPRTKEVGCQAEAGRVVCLNCGGRLAEPAKCTPVNSHTSCVAKKTDSASSTSSVKSILLQKTSSPAKHKFSKETVNNNKCICVTNYSEDEECTGENKWKPPPTKRWPKYQETTEQVVCSSCGGFLSDSDVHRVQAEYRRMRTKSEEVMDEAIMKKREEVWGNNVPPGFIIPCTAYAQRHDECCVDKADADSAVYTCPNWKFKCTAIKSEAEEEEEEEREEEEEEAARNERVTVECVYTDERRAAVCRPIPRRSTDDKSQTAGARRKPRPRPDASKQQKECRPEVVVTTDDSGKLVSFTCKAVRDEAEPYGKKTSAQKRSYTDSDDGADTGGWYQKINKQIRTYMEIDDEGNDERPANAGCCSRETLARKTDAQSPVISCSFTLKQRPPPATTTTTDTTGSKGESGTQSMQTQTSVSCIGPGSERNGNRTKETQTPKEVSGSSTSVRPEDAGQRRLCKPIGSVTSVCLCAKHIRETRTEKKDNKARQSKTSLTFHTSNESDDLYGRRSADSVSSQQEKRPVFGEPKPDDGATSSDRFGEFYTDEGTNGEGTRQTRR